MATIQNSATISIGSGAEPALNVGHYIVRAVPVARTDERAGRVRERLIGHRCECASHVFVVAETGRLIGVADIGGVLAAGSAAPLADLAHTTKSLLAV